MTNSTYPILCWFLTLSLTFSFVFWFKTGIIFNVIMSSFFILMLMKFWFKDVQTEGILGSHNNIVMDGIKYGMVLFIFSEVMFFSGFFWAFFDSSMSPNVETGLHWSPLGVCAINPFDIPLLNTMVLLSSGITATISHHQLINNKESSLFLLVTILLGAYFTFLQGFEYKISSFTISEGIFGTTFFVATGFHGIHVTIGTCFLLVCFIRMLLLHFNAYHHIGYEAALWYWHFVDVVWLFLYSFVYWWAFY